MPFVQAHLSMSCVDSEVMHRLTKCWVVSAICIHANKGLGVAYQRCLNLVCQLAGIESWGFYT
jgi:ribosomal protein S5